MPSDEYTQCKLAGSYEHAASAQVAARGLTLEAVVADIADLVTTRHALGLHHGVILIPEGLVEFVPSMRVLIAELNDSIGKLPDSCLRGMRAYGHTVMMVTQLSGDALGVAGYMC